MRREERTHARAWLNLSNGRCPCSQKKIPNLMLVLIGEEPQRALKSSGTEWQRSSTAAKSVGMERRITALGAADDVTLAMAYRESDFAHIPVLNLPGDVKDFGKVSVEAVAHGLPTVAFAVGGVPDAIKNGNSGCLVSAGNYIGLTDAVVRCLNEKPAGVARPMHGSCEEFFLEYPRGRTTPDLS